MPEPASVTVATAYTSLYEYWPDTPSGPETIDIVWFKLKIWLENMPEADDPPPLDVAPSGE